jgi:hypothetical protein
MITISFLEEIDGEPTSTPQNDVILAARRCPSVNELGPRGPEYFMPREALGLQTYAEAAAAEAKAQKKSAPAFSVIVNGMLLDKMRAEDGERPGNFDDFHFAA